MRPRLVSVVIPARGAARTLAGQLDAVAGQDYDGAFELVVALNGGRDGTDAVARDWIAARGLGRIVDATRGRGPGFARNAGARAAGGDFLAFCDADDVVSARWLTALVAAAADADLVGGPSRSDRLNDPLVRAANDIPDPGEPFHGFLPAASGSNCGVWRRVFDALGGFDERSRTGEDVAFSWRAQLAGYRLAVADGALVHKRFRASSRAIGSRFFRYGMGDAWLFSEFGGSGMPRRTTREAAAEWGQIVRGLPSLAGTPGRSGRVVLMAGLSLGRLAGSVRHRARYL